MKEETGSSDGRHQRDAVAWKQIVAQYKKPSTSRALWQFTSTLGAYLLVWWLLYLSLTVSWWLTAPLAILAGGLLVRIFIIFHDCGHGSFLNSQKANHILGFITGVLAWSPYYQWRSEHAAHHAAAGDLDRRGMGDIWTLTVQEYLDSSRWRRAAYRLARNPVVLFVVAPLFVFLFRFRIPRA